MIDDEARRYDDELTNIFEKDLSLGVRHEIRPDHCRHGSTRPSAFNRSALGHDLPAEGSVGSDRRRKSRGDELMGYVERTVRGGKVRYKARYEGSNGKEYSRTFDKKSDADNHLAAQRVSKKKGDWVDPNLGKVKVAAWIERWFPTTQHLKPTTRAGYRSVINTCTLPAFGNIQLRQVQNIDVKEWVSGMTARGLGSSRTTQAKITFGAIMKAAVENGYIGKNPCTGVKLPPPSRREMRFLDADEVSQLAAEVDDRYRALILTLCYGGLRWGEAAALKRGRCDLLRSRLEIRESVSEVNGTLHFGTTKTDRVRWVRLPAFLRDVLAEHLAQLHRGRSRRAGVHDSGRRRAAASQLPPSRLVPRARGCGASEDSYP